MEQESPKTVTEFEQLTWNQKRQLKESSPDVYWYFIRQIKNEERKEN